MAKRTKKASPARKARPSRSASPTKKRTGAKATKATKKARPGGKAAPRGRPGPASKAKKKVGGARRAAASRRRTEPGPERPASVPGAARFVAKTQRWTVDELRSGGAEGTSTRWWSREGRLLREEQHDPHGASLVLTYREEDGTLETREEREGDRRVLYEDFHRTGALRRRRRWNVASDEIYSASWRADGELEEEQEWTYAGSKLVATRRRGPGGVPLVDIAREGREDCYTFFHGSGQRRAEGRGKGGRAIGRWRFFDGQGALFDEVDAGPLRFTDLEPEHIELLRDQARLAEHVRGGAPLPEQLEGVREVPWRRVAGAWSDDVRRFPELLAAMTAPDRRVQRLALQTIFEECCQEGALFEAAARVSPFLVRLLEHPATDRLEILETLNLLGAAASARAEEAEAPPSDGEADAEDWRRAVLGTLEALRAGWPTVSKLLEASDPGIRSRAVQLAAFAEGQPGVQQAVRRRVDAEPDRSVRATAAHTLLTARPRAALKHLGLVDDGDLLVRAAAAFSAAIRFGPDSPARVVEVLAEALLSWRELAGSWAELPFIGDHLLADLSLGLGSVRSDSARALLPDLCALVDEVDEDSAPSFGRGLLALALGTGRPYAPRFVDALEALAGSERFFSFGPSAAEVLRAWCLPPSAAELRAVAKALRATSDPEGTLHHCITGCAGCRHLRAGETHEHEQEQTEAGRGAR